MHVNIIVVWWVIDFMWGSEINSGKFYYWCSLKVIPPPLMWLPIRSYLQSQLLIQHHSSTHSLLLIHSLLSHLYVTLSKWFLTPLTFFASWDCLFCLFIITTKGDKFCCIYRISLVFPFLCSNIQALCLQMRGIIIK